MGTAYDHIALITLDDYHLSRNCLSLSLSLSVSLLTYFSKVKCAVITWKTLVISFLLNWTPQTQILSLKHTQLYTLSETPIHTHTLHEHDSLLSSDHKCLLPFLSHDSTLSC